jgi:hypothetical protein
MTKQVWIRSPFVGHRLTSSHEPRLTGFPIIPRTNRLQNYKPHGLRNLTRTLKSILDKERPDQENTWHISLTGSRDSTGSVWLRARRSGFDPLEGQRIFLLVPASISALGPTQPPIQWVPGVLSPGVKRGRGVMLTTHPHIVPRFIMSRCCTSFPPCASMGCSGITLPLSPWLLNYDDGLLQSIQYL